MAARPTARLADTALLARVSQAAGQPEGVERAWRAAVARFPTDAAAHWRLINMLAAEQKYPAAMQAFDAAQRLVPDDPSLLLTASMVQARAGRPAEALALANRLVAAAPTDTLARLNLAGLQQATGDKTAAATTYRGVLASQPDNIFALNNLALLQTESDPAGAVALARRAQRLQPRDPEVLDTLAAALLKLGRGGEAVATMRESVAIDPANPRRRYRLALVQEASGDLPGARATLNELVNAAPFPDLDAARAALRRLSR
jgi:Flp pilus assembly protein TadD